MPEKLVVDANVVISSLITKGIPSSVFSLNAILGKFEFIAPEFLLEEVKKHKSKALRFTKLSEQEFEEAYEFFIDEIIFISAFLPISPRIFFALAACLSAMVSGRLHAMEIPFTSAFALPSIIVLP